MCVFILLCFSVLLFLLDILCLCFVLFLFFCVDPEQVGHILGELGTFRVFVHSFVCFVLLRIFSQALVYFRMGDFSLGQ